MRNLFTITLMNLVFASIAAGTSGWSPSVSVQVTTPQRYCLSIGISGSNWEACSAPIQVFFSESNSVCQVLSSMWEEGNIQLPDAPNDIGLDNTRSS